MEAGGGSHAHSSGVPNTNIVIYVEGNGAAAIATVSGRGVERGVEPLVVSACTYTGVGLRQADTIMSNYVGVYLENSNAATHARNESVRARVQLCSGGRGIQRHFVAHQPLLMLILGLGG